MSVSFHRAYSFLIAAFGLFTLIGCGGSESSSESASSGADKIKVGQFYALSGEQATFGISSKKGSELAFAEINAAGGVRGGAQLEHITFDTRGIPQETGNAVTRLINNEKVVALLGEVASSLSDAGGQVAQEYRVPMITPASTNPKVTQIGDMVHRICFIDPFQGFVVAKFLKENKNATKVAVLFDQGQAYSVGLKDAFLEAYPKMGGEILTVQSYSSGDQDFSAQLTNIRDLKPDAIFIPGYYTEVANIALQAKRLGVNTILIGGDGWTSEKLTEIAGDSIEGAYYSNHYSPEDSRPKVQEFIKNFKEAYGGETPDAMAALAYDSVYILADAMNRAESLEPDDLAAAIASTKDFDGVTGKITLNAERNAEKDAVILQIQNGESRFVTTVSPN
ncbi:MAG: ABC transporter substrate-binding protein [Candidatus Sumerlaeia bacterium]|nr:ABC transporter substrate-binding protein [Candidatus Sumerlaeia bacterium]